MLKNFAAHPDLSSGRIYKEKKSKHHNPFQRDIRRIVHSKAFRRLEYKTQVFINHEGDHYRNRLTHSIEVSLLARTIARSLGVSEDLAESIALAHDIGHTAFGHAGEEALQKNMKNYGGFCHNLHAIKIVTELEKQYINYNGLNLTYESLEGIIKHNGPIRKSIPKIIKELNNILDFKLDLYGSAEAQIASLADDITYIIHDIDDGIRSGMISLYDLHSVDIIKNITNEINLLSSDVEESILYNEVSVKLRNYFIEDLLKQSNINIIKEKINHIDDIRNAKYSIIDFSPITKQTIKEIKNLLFKKLYRHTKVMKINEENKKIINTLFKLYFQSPDLIERKSKNQLKPMEINNKAVMISDYIAGMTDRYAIKIYQSIKNK